VGIAAKRSRCRPPHELDSVRVSVDGDFSGDPAASGPVTYDGELHGSGDLEALARGRPDRGDSELAAAENRRFARRSDRIESVDRRRLDEPGDRPRQIPVGSDEDVRL
jgi:hypothetical protein